MEWYNILFFFVLSIFVIKLVITLFFGDTDIDFDVDGDIDFDISSMFSFKGILHFLLGFSSYLAAVAHFNDTYQVYGESYQFSIANYILGIIIGFIFMFGLYYIYQLVMKFNHYNNENINVNGYTGTVLIKHGQVNTNEYGYTLLVNTPMGSRKISVLSTKSDINIGDEHKIYMNEQGIYCI